ncbi:hypothetical protein ACH5RR_036559 [Cinchona calisaya]|uniref:Uncharacterized protein n=1 Tax=Cinchona calisaya TaxID=153742 RepID=A0ABD2Y7E3_9GENT
MTSYEETYRELGMEFDADRVKGPYNVHDDGHDSDDGHESDDPKLNSLAQPAQSSQPPPAHRDKDVEDYFVAMSKAKVPMFEGSANPDKADKWFGQIEEILVLLKVPEPLKPEVVTPFLEGEAKV